MSARHLQSRSTVYLRTAYTGTLRTKVETHTKLDLNLENVVRSPFPDVLIPKINLYDYIFQNSASLAQKIAIVKGETGREYSFLEIEETTRKVSSALNRSGLQKGDVVALATSNCPEYPVMFLATLASGGVVTTCNPAYTDEELTYQFTNSSPKFVVTVPSVLPTVQKAAEKSGAEKIIVLNDTEQRGSSFISYRSLVEDSGSRFNLAPVDAKNDIAVLPYSSGTTGLPKGVMLTHYTMIANISQLKHPEIFSLHKDGTTIMGLLPFYHIYGMDVIMLSSLHAGSKLVTLSKFSPDTFLSAIQKYKINLTHLVPPLIQFLANHPSVDKYDLSSIDQVTSASAPLSGELLTAARERIGCRLIRQLYGLTEMNGAVLIMPECLGMTKPGSVGVPICNMEVRIVDTVNGENLPVGKTGEMLVRGPNIMKGYLNLPDTTKASITEDGWFRTGDIGYFDEEGCFYITDRLKELIKVKGLQVAPAELEALLQNHPKIADAAVIGIPNERLGEAPKAFVVKKDPTVTEDEIVNYVAGKVAKHKHLVGGVEFIDVVPKSVAGKILRRVLRDNQS